MRYAIHFQPAIRMASNGNGMSSVEPPAPDMAEPEQESTGTNGFVIQEDANTTYIPDVLHFELHLARLVMQHIIYFIDVCRGIDSMSASERTIRGLRQAVAQLHSQPRSEIETEHADSFDEEGREIVD